jgi:pimeloyl-[acyl-carrier protein] methyl ester esterase
VNAHLPPSQLQPQAQPTSADALYVEVRGQGPPLVLLHGWALNLRVFDPIVSLLERQFTTHAFDLPGHGRSAGPFAVSAVGGAAEAATATTAVTTAGEAGPSLVDSLAARILLQLPARFRLCGWSLGGQIAMAIAARAPERVEALCLVATTPRFNASADWPHGVRSAVLPQLLANLREDPRRAVTDLLELQLRGSRNAANLLHGLQQALLDHGAAPPEVLQAGVDFLSEVDLRDRVAQIRAPSLVVAGEYDRVTLPAAGRWLAQRLPSGEYHEFSRAAHAPFLSHPQQFAQLLLNFHRQGLR